MKLKIFFLSLVVFCVLALPLSAQQSNLNRATLSVFGSDVDNFMNVNHWADVDLEKDFGFVGISPAQYALEVGYAHQFDAFRLGAYYNGNIFQTTTPITKTKSVVTTNTYGADGAVTAMISKITFEGVSGGVGVSQNNIGVLVGLGGMGFKLGFADNTTTTFTNQGASTKTETVATNTVTLNEYSDVSNVTGTVTPTLAWGTSLAMNGMTVLPHAQLSLGFYTNKDNYKRSQITTVAGTETSNVQTTNADDTGYFNPGIALGADVIFAENNGVKMSAGFTYNGTFRIYGNKNGLTQYIDSDITVAGVRIESITDNKPSPKMSGSVNNFTPSFAMGKDWDRLSLGFNVALPFGFDSTSTTANSVNMTDAKTTTNNVFTGRTVTTTTTEGLSAATNTTFTFVPRLNMGFRYKVGEDDRWTINGGFGVKFPDANVLTAKPTTQTKTVVKQDVYVTEGGSPTTTTTTTMTPAVTESTTTTTTWNPMTADLNGGLTFNFTENFYLDGNFNIAALNFSVFGLLTTNMNLQFVVKF